MIAQSSKALVSEAAKEWDRYTGLRQIVERIFNRYYHWIEVAPGRVSNAIFSLRRHRDPSLEEAGFEL